MTYDEIHPAMRAALGTFEMLRRLGFKSADIFFHQNANEPTNPLEPRGMMFVVLKTQGKEFTIRVGLVESTYEAWVDEWQAVVAAALEHRIEEADRIVEESEAFRRKVDFLLAIRAKGIRIPSIPSANRHLS